MSLFATTLLLALSTQAQPPQTQSPSTPAPVVALGCLQSAAANGEEQLTLTMKDTNAAKGEVSGTARPAPSRASKTRTAIAREATGIAPGIITTRTFLINERSATKARSTTQALA